MTATCELAHDAALADALEKFRTRGPDRVLLASGAAVGPQRAEALGAGDWDVVLIRDDGWMLACSRERYEAARATWQEGWIAVICYAKTSHRVLIRIVSQPAAAERFRISRNRDQQAGRMTLTVTDTLTGDSEEFPDYVGIMGPVNRWKAEQIKKASGG